MRYVNIPERTRIMNQALRATTFAEIAAANLEMDRWVAAHPEDLGIRDAYEVLDNMQENAEFQQQELSRRSPAGVS